MKFFGWLLFLGSIAWGAMIIADPGKVAGLHFGNDECEIHERSGTSLATLSCQRCGETAIHSGKRCKTCESAEQHYMSVSGDSKPGIRLAAADPVESDGVELHLGHSPYLGYITPFHLKFTVGSILLPLLIGTFCIFAVDHEKAKK